MSVNKCNKCRKEVDVNNGGCAIMLAFCHNHSTNLINVSFCSDCYDELVDKELRVLNEKANLRIHFDEDDEA